MHDLLAVAAERQPAVVLPDVCGGPWRREEGLMCDPAKQPTLLDVRFALERRIFSQISEVLLYPKLARPPYTSFVPLISDVT